jgi:hypothetical protein
MTPLQEGEIRLLCEFALDRIISSIGRTGKGIVQILIGEEKAL